MNSIQDTLSDAARHALVTFTGGLTGATDDKNAVWAWAAERAGTAGESVADALRRATTPAGEDPGDPPQGQVQAAVNPFTLIVQKLFGANLVGVLLDEDYLSDPQWDLNLRRLRQLLPPHLLFAYSTDGVLPVGQT